MKVPRKISSIISSVQTHKLPGCIYNIPEEYRKPIIDSIKKGIIIDAFNINYKYYLINKIASDLGFDPGDKRAPGPLLIKIEEALKDGIILIDHAEYLSTPGYTQIVELMKSKLPVIIFSSYPNFITRLRDTKFYKNNIILEFDYNELK